MLAHAKPVHLRVVRSLGPRSVGRGAGAGERKVGLLVGLLKCGIVCTRYHRVSNDLQRGQVAMVP